MPSSYLSYSLASAEDCGLSGSRSARCEVAPSWARIPGSKPPSWRPARTVPR